MGSNPEAMVAMFGGQVGLNVEQGVQQKAAIKRQIIQEKMRRNTEQIASDQKMEQLNATQIAKAAGSGFDYSGSFANLTAENIQKYGKDSHIKDLSSESRISSMKVEYHNVMKKVWINSFEQGAKAASQFAELG